MLAFKFNKIEDTALSLAIFDLDNTLLNGDSDHAWGEFLCDHSYVDADEYRRLNNLFYEQYEAGVMDINEFLTFALKPLADNSLATLKGWHQQYMAQCIKPMLQEKAATLLKKHKDNGDYTLIITATNRFVTEPIADLLGVDELLATEPEMINGEYTGAVSGTPCYQAGKVERLHQWLANNDHSLENSYFYSDSHNDLPLLELVEHPHATNADAKLTGIAKERNWPILDLRP